LSIEPTLWRKVVEAIESTMPEYDRVNERISLGLASKARTYAVEQLGLTQGMIALDAGIGPGTMSEILLSRTPGMEIVGLDASTKLLHAARERFSTSFRSEVHLVKGVFEALPFKKDAFPRIVSAYAFRDSRNRTEAIREFCRVTAADGTFAIVDVGKPNNRFIRLGMTFYMRYVVPLIASRSKSNAIGGNPWRMIFPTYMALAKNRDLVNSLRVEFSEVDLREFGFGGVVAVFAHKVRISDR
jgi:demethylmenaquinone methyltransferase/2-methoxy-6-polyprenyl-1,4-benzoquinol methylase